MITDVEQSVEACTVARDFSLTPAELVGRQLGHSNATLLMKAGTASCRRRRRELVGQGSAAQDAAPQYKSQQVGEFWGATN
jgi:hypothetical protein